MRRMKGIFFTMDAAAALLVILVSTASVFSLLAMSEQSSESMLSLSRTARDAYEISRTSAIPSSINTVCTNANISASSVNIYYDKVSNTTLTRSITVCP